MNKMNKLNQLEIDEILAKSKDASLDEYSLGFRRLYVLPERVRKNIDIACILKGETTNLFMKKHLNSLTEKEFMTWLKHI